MQTMIGLRRSERVLLDVPVVICGQAEGDGAFREETFTMVVNAHGALIVLETKVSKGQKLLLMNPSNWDEREAKVSFVGPAYAGLSKVGVEFMRPSPEFWPLASPPSDWHQDCQA